MLLFVLLKEKTRSLDRKMEGVDGQLNFFFSQIGNLSKYIKYILYYIFCLRNKMPVC